MEAKDSWATYSKNQEKKTVNQEFFIEQKYTSKMKEKIKMFLDE